MRDQDVIHIVIPKDTPLERMLDECKIALVRGGFLPATIAWRELMMQVYAKGRELDAAGPEAGYYANLCTLLFNRYVNGERTQDLYDAARGAVAMEIQEEAE